MSRSRFAFLLVACTVALVALPACSDGTLLDGALAPSANEGNAGVLTAALSGAEEVPANDSLARGQAVFRVRDDGIHYRLVVANLFDVLQAHIHLAPAGQNGPVVAYLYPDAPPAVLLPGRNSGLLAEGIITAADLRGPLQDQPLEDLVAALVAGGVYVNVHTSSFPPGEIRGQIR